MMGRTISSMAIGALVLAAVILPGAAASAGTRRDPFLILRCSRRAQLGCSSREGLGGR